ncbi:lysylphosphatidylglycerol synthase transmembrane domain-containing protein [Microbacterium panaciterrae]|uniref:Lysylphosphatidylglycerol synthase transmembrane domain-containing protein n=1 Tax=Microbacterium panaciterrae TaxID=985759 RepID=A0ABP8P972_9MICO
MAAMSTVAEVRADTGLVAPRRPAFAVAIRVGAAIAIIAVMVLVVGFGPFLRGIAAISPLSIMAALILAAVGTAAAAWRWHLVAAGYGLPLSWRTAFGAYYRSQFLNSVLPAGFAGDVHRAWMHGRAHQRVGAAARAVAVERILGQGVQIVLTLVILLPLGFGSSLVPVAWGAGALAAAVAVGAGIALMLPRARRLLRRELDLLRPVLARPRALLAIVAASVVVVASHTTLFVVACRVTGPALHTAGAAAVGLAVLAASAVPINVGGWGPREAAAGAAFALVGFAASAGVAASTAFGVLALVGVLPGAVVLLIGRRRRG